MKGSARSRGYRRTFTALATLVAAGALLSAPHVARAQFTCAGDCQGTGTPGIGGVITLVNIVLGNADPSTCPHGLEGAASVSTVIQAVNNILNGTCAAPTPTPTAFCGNGTVDAGEDCDNGGVCIGGTNAGTACTSESQCSGQGVCTGGTKAEWACDTDADCPGSACRHCIPQEGNGCAANCTTETTVNVALVPGQNPPGDSTSIVDGTSGLTVNSPTLTIGIPIPANTTRQLLIGKMNADGTIPVALKAAANQTAGISVLGGQACICLRPVILETCGGTLWQKDGTPSLDCTANYTAGGSVCTSASANPCTLVYGKDNAGTGVVGCGSSGLPGVDLTATQDSGGSSGMPKPVLSTLADAGPTGSAVVYETTELGFVIAPCTGTDQTMYGPDGMFCTDDDPQSARGTVLPQVLTTGKANATVLNADSQDPSCSISGTTCQADSNCPAGETCVPNDVGPFKSQGTPVSCSALVGGSASGGALAGGFPDLNAPVVGDIVVTDTQVAQ